MLTQEPSFTMNRLATGAVGSERLNGQVRRVPNLTTAERAQMYELLACYFAHTTPAQFERDLAEKAWAILLTNPLDGRIQGFSTLMRFQSAIDGQTVHAYFSGDTIIRREYWGEIVLPRLWSQHVFGLAEATPEIDAYWFLICSGYKTYRFLSVFFRQFYPTYKRPTPPQLKRLLDHLGRQKFGDEYHAAEGVVRFSQATPLREGVAEIAARRLKDPHIAFFAAANPGHGQGDELACLTRLTRANLTPAGLRMLGLGHNPTQTA